MSDNHQQRGFGREVAGPDVGFQKEHCGPEHRTKGMGNGGDQEEAAPVFRGESA